ncbi:hypothetical protein [Desulfobotulus mexicanus]|uniref:Uncharacterized protein n=1 Tax=Desulfobotulus mexicanus TaxID=2586642 RepID=A0A5Q4VF74_9BACT|nr:hypothetical protein [Desulfobotulus mexicanus]TYT74691.1 hypothetical protein FIM25_08885 [Desulfobotulus mexicanus]
MKETLKPLWLISLLISLLIITASLLLLASDLAQRRSTASFRIDNVVPQLLDINKEVLNRYPKWKMTEKLQEMSEKQQPGPQASEQAVEKKTVPFRIRMVLYSETEFAERSRDGYLEGLRKAGLEPGRD